MSMASIVNHGKEQIRTEEKSNAKAQISESSGSLKSLLAPAMPGFEIHQLLVETFKFLHRFLPDIPRHWHYLPAFQQNASMVCTLAPSPVFVIFW